MLKYRFKIILKEKVIFFWTLLFPMILATFFNFTLKDAFNVDKVMTLNLAVLQNEAYESELPLQSLIDSVDMINPVFVSSKEAGIVLVEKGEVSGLLSLDEDLSLYVKGSSSESSTLSYIFDTYQKQSSMLNRMFAEDPSLMGTDVVSERLQVKEYFSPNTQRNNETVVVIYFYTTIAMLCIYAGQWGIKSASYLQADDSDVAKRLNIAPTSKLKLLLMDILVVFIIYSVQFVILFSYLKYALEIPFGDATHVIVLTALLGGLVNILLGYVMSITFKNKSYTIVSYAGMFASFLAGMQFVGMKYLVEQYVPILALLNPAALITDNFYVSYYYPTLSRAYSNLGILGLMILVIGFFGIYKMKGVSYDSL